MDGYLDQYNIKKNINFLKRKLYKNLLYEDLEVFSLNKFRQKTQECFFCEYSEKPKLIKVSKTVPVFMIQKR